ncbi:hypothetical protein T12_14285 [Trichinella patagoniensis]|uniref:Uncharacterized protein n=1 Tax=Trichinella patagoniensis TaxID=990121 RepID=A0A0V1A0W1_9BILA|nr:hypothetical protein T12_14285 [Trichinella patagoniensis]
MFNKTYKFSTPKAYIRKRDKWKLTLWTKMTKVLCGHRFGSISLLLFISHHLPPINDDYPIQLTPPPPPL